MKIRSVVCCTLLLTLGHALAEEEAWYLEMEPHFAELILKKYQAQDKKPYLQALEMIPGLVKAGKITEIEKISRSDTEKGGLHFPQRMVEVEETEGYIHTIGSKYYRANKNDLRFFSIDTKKKDIESEVIATAGELPGQWQPSFLLEKGSTVKLLLERDTAAKTEFFDLEHRLKVARTVPDKLSATWLISRQFMVSIPLPRLEPGPVFEYSDTDQFVYPDQDDVTNLGVVLCWSLTQDRRFSFEISNTELASKTSYSVTVQTAKGEISSPGPASTAEIRFHHEELKGEELERKDKKSPGTVEYGLVPMEK